MVLLLTVLGLAADARDILQWLIDLPGAVFGAYGDFLRWALHSVHTLFERYGYWVVFLGTLSENTLFVGLIVPGAFVVILAGLAAETGSMSLSIAIALGVLGTVIGDTISYCLGRYGWSRFGSARMFRDVNEKVREPLLRRGAMFVLFYHFAGYTRVVGPAAAGFLKMPYRLWAPYDYAGAVLWVCSYSAIGVALGKIGVSFDSTDGWFRIVEWALLVVVLAWGYYLYRVGQRALMRHQAETVAQEAEQAETLPEPSGTGTR